MAVVLELVLVEEGWRRGWRRGGGVVEEGWRYQEVKALVGGGARAPERTTRTVDVHSWWRTCILYTSTKV